MKCLSKFFLAVLLLTMASISWAACPEGYKNNYKGECVPVAGENKGSYPCGGTCDPIAKREVLSIASVITGASPTFTNDQQACKHNIRVIEDDDEKILKISTRLGDRIGNNTNSKNYWSDIEEGNRRRIELKLNKRIKTGDEFRFEYSIRIPEDHRFLISGQYEYPWFEIIQLKSSGRNIGPVIKISVDRRQGILTFGGNTIQPVKDFGKWVKIAIEFRPSRKENGYARLWVDDKLVYEVFDYKNIHDGEPKNSFDIKFGIYQGVEGRTNSMIHQKQQQSVEFKGISLKMIN